MKRFFAALAVGFVLTLCLASTAFAASHHATQRGAVVAPQASGECAIGEICQVEQSGLLNETNTNVKDPPGATIRSLTAIAVLAALFVVYLRWALQRGKTVG